MNFPHIYFYWKARNRDINISKKCNNHLTNTGAQQKNIIKMNKAKSWHKDIDQKNNLYSHQKNKMKKKNVCTATDVINITCGYSVLFIYFEKMFIPVEFMYSSDRI